MNMDKSRVVCHCMNVTVGDIKNALDAGAKNFEDVRNVTRAGTGCGTCEEEVRAIIEKLQKP